MAGATQKRKRRQSVKQILGIVGEKRAGKDTFCEIFAAYAGEKGFTVSVHRYSDIIGACLELMDIPKTRENLQAYPPLIESKWGKGVFSRAMTARVEKDTADIIVIQGIRWWTDVTELRKLGGRLVYVTAVKKIRFARSLGNSEKPDESNISWQKFEKQEQAETEVYIPDIATNADFRFNNNSSQTVFAIGIRAFIDTHI